MIILSQMKEIVMQKVDKLSQTQEIKIVRKEIKEGLQSLADKYLNEEKRKQQQISAQPSGQ